MTELLINVTGTIVTHDETAGLQNGLATPLAAGDADDDDVSFSSIPAALASRLTAVNAPATLIGAAASDGNVVTFSPIGNLGNVTMTDANGDPLNGVDSGLDTADGQNILLYTDSGNDNIVLGRTTDGTIVFAIYLEETGGTPPTGGKLWTVQYQPIDHGADGNDFDSAVDLTNLVYVTASQASDFSFAGAPSGNSLFMLFGSASQALLVTGVDPANESAGENVSSGDTVNTGQGGGDTTLGTGGQQIKAQDALIITFVTGANANVTVPNLSPGEATDENSIQFSGYLDTKAASFKISQMTPGNTNTTATVEIQAYKTADGTGDSYIDANPLVTGDQLINIASVQVLRAGVDITGTLGVTVTLSGHTATITGVKENDEILYSTTEDHNRVLIRNDQPESGAGSNIAFDLGGFTLTEVTGDTDEIGSKIVFEDDGPAIDLAPTTAVIGVDESVGIGGSSQDEPGNAEPDDEAATGAPAGAIGYAVTTKATLFTETADAGSDAQASKLYTLVLNAGATGLTDAASGQAVVLSLTGDVIEGRTATSGDLVFSIAVDATSGDVTTVLYRALDHGADLNDHDNAVNMTSGLVQLQATLTDGDTDTASDTIELGSRIDFEDDGPAIDLAPTTAVIGVDESVGTSGSSQDEPGNAEPDDEAVIGAPAGAIGYAVTTAASLFTETADAGSDAQASKVYTLVLNAGATGLTDSASSQAVVLSLTAGGMVEGRTATSGDLVFSIAVDASSGDVTTVLYRALDHGADLNDHDNAVKMSSGLVQLQATLTDGDTDTASDTIELGSRIDFEDDGPDVAVENAAGTFADGATSTWTNAVGSDTFQSLEVTLDSYKIGAGSTVAVNSSLGTVTEADVNGNYVYEGSITADFTDDGKANLQVVDFTLTFNADDDTYRIDLGTVPVTVTTFDTSQGTLKAGGPDAVQTLLFGGTPPTEAGNDDIVFFGVIATAVQSDLEATDNDSILDLVGREIPDLTEAAIELLLPLPSLINAATQMNVSTAGIGINNNNLDGANQGVGTGVFAGTSITSGDESFVVNPETPVDSMKVYISSTVQGYKPATEDLYYTVYYTDGTVSGPVEVTAGMLTQHANNDLTVPKEARGGSSFLVDGGDKQIDAVQLTMGVGTVKIPIIAFSVEQVFAPELLEMNLTAELFDGDGDSDSDAFSITLDAEVV